MSVRFPVPSRPFDAPFGFRVTISLTGVRGLARAPGIALLVMAMTLLPTACGGDRAEAEPAPSAPPPQLESIEAPWAEPGLREVVELQLDRNGAELTELLGSEDPRIRARAALALGSVQDPEAAQALARLLNDPEPGVRREAAFAMGQVSQPDGGQALLNALADESDEEVRLQLLDALGKRVARGVADGMMSFESRTEREEVHYLLALSRMGLSQVAPEGMVERIVEALSHPEPGPRKAAAYLFGRSVTPELWNAERDRLREALDRLARNDPAAIQLLLGLGLLRDWADVPRLREWLRSGEDWRIRVAAARALGEGALVEASGVREALLDAMEADPSVHVAVAASTALTGGAGPAPELMARARRLLLEGPADRWPAHLSIVEYWVAGAETGPALEWARRVGGLSPLAALRTVQLLAPLPADEVTDFLHQMADHGDPRVRAMALLELGHRWRSVPMGEAEMASLRARLVAALEEGAPVEVARAAQVLESPGFRSSGVGEEVLEAIRARVATPGDDPVLVLTSLFDLAGQLQLDAALPLLREGLAHPEPRVRAAAGHGIERIEGQRPSEGELPDPERRIDWDALEALGPEPRLHIETGKGTLILRLDPTQAPQTVQAITELAAQGRYDGSYFHRVVPGFVAQGGDVSLGDGQGSPGFAIRSEFTRIPFQRGVVGMASSGKDTEGSQFFVAHARAPHLDGNYTAFGWLVSGEEVLDGILEGDVIEGMEVVVGQRDPDPS